MASRAISGKPGGGKSYLATRWILKELQDTQRPIVTNVPLNLPAIVKYCIKIGRDDIDVYSRIILLPWEHVKTFWRYRGNGWVAPECGPEEYKKGERPAIETFPAGGVAYYLDELHEHLNSREWANTGGAVLYYLAKHRHLGDDIVWITQSCANVDKQWRSVTQDYTYCRNWSKEKWNGWSKGKGFQAVTYLDMLTGAAQLPPACDTENYKIEKDVCACYQTSIVGQAADTGDKVRAYSIKWVYAGIVALCLAVCALFIWGPGVATRMVVGKTQSKAVAVSGSSAAVVSEPLRQEVPKSLPVFVVPADGPDDVKYFAEFKPYYDSTRKQIVVSGSMDSVQSAISAYRAGRYVFWLEGRACMGGHEFVTTDRGSFMVGDWCREPSGQVQAINKNVIVVNGVEYQLRWKNITNEKKDNQAYPASQSIASGPGIGPDGKPR